MVTQDNDFYDIVFGHRRFDAFTRLGWDVIPALIVTGEEAEIRRKTFAENFFRDNLTSVELAIAIAEEIKSERSTVEQLATCFKHKPDWIRRQISICCWPVDCLDAVHTGKLSVSAAENLSCITDDSYRESVVRQACDNGATARTTAAWLQAWRSMLPVDEAVLCPPSGSPDLPVPLVPQAPCLACHDVFRTDELSHVPLCSRCIKIIADSGRG
jgi:ParB family chromosome partitioning protein